MGAIAGFMGKIFDITTTLLSAGIVKIINDLDYVQNWFTNVHMIAIYNAIKPIGLSLVIVYFLIELMEQSTHDNFTLEHIIKSLIKLLIGILMISNLWELLFGIADFAASLSTEVLLDTVKARIISTPNVNGMGPVAMAGEGISFLMDCIPIALMVIAAFFVSAVRNVNIAVFICFAPIGVSNIFTRGLDSFGMKYLRRYLALCVQIVVMSSIVVLYFAMIECSFGLSGYGSDWVVELLGGFAAASLMIKSKELSEHICAVI